MGLLNRRPRDEFITAWGATLLDPVSRVPIRVLDVLLSLYSQSIHVSDRIAVTRTLWVRDLAELESIFVDGNQLMAMFADKRGYQAMAFDFAVSDSADASTAATQILSWYRACMAGLGRPALATITTTPPAAAEALPPTPTRRVTSKRRR